MHSKKSKNKNRPNKPPNPVPPQKNETVNLERENKLELESEQTVEEKVQEVTEVKSEVIVENVETKEQVEDSPKKPKRNKGKKKKHENEEDDQEKNINPSIEEVKHEETSPENTKIDKSEIKIDTVTPTARKKKNKDKKSIEQVVTEQKVVQAVISVEENTSLEQKLEQEVKQELHLPEVDQEQKSLKKKNKRKKNRNDSEKSDKGLDVMVTEASQNVTPTKSDETKDESEANKALNIITDDDALNKQLSSQKYAETNQEIIISNKESIEMTGNISKDEHKNKKKNKKDKKHYVKTEEVLKPIESQVAALDKTEKIGQAEVPKDSTEEKSKNLTTKTSPKPKTKIIKPVEKKPIEQTDNLSIIPERTEQGAKEEIPVECSEMIYNLRDQSLSENISNLKPDDIINKSEIVSEIGNIASPCEDTTVIIETAFIPVPDGGMGKKRTKSPQPENTPETAPTIPPKLENIEQVKLLAECGKTSREVSPRPITVEILSPFEQKPTFIQETDVLKLSDQCKKISQETKHFDETRKTESKSRKKGRKSKSPMKHPPEQNIETENKSITESNIDKEKKEQSSILELPILETLEVSSVKTEESEDTFGNTSPDFIEYPRSNSQQELDNNNNNMIIQDISTVKDVKVVVPVGVAESPVSNVGDISISTDINIPNVKTDEIKSIEPEKTDLKSKMMEVNQDMEELRLSIERSLAELTAIEKSEADIEKEVIDKSKIKISESKSDQDNNNKNLENICKEMEANKFKDCIPAIVTETKETVVDKEVEKKKQEETESINIENKENITKTDIKESLQQQTSDVHPIVPARKDHKGKSKSKKKGKQETQSNVQSISSTSTTTTTTSSSKDTTDDNKKDDKSDQKDDNSQKKGKQQSSSETNTTKANEGAEGKVSTEFQPIENFEDALTSSIDDVNKTFEMIVTEADDTLDVFSRNTEKYDDDHENPEKDQEKVHPVSQPKNLLGHPHIPVPSNRTDYKKEKNKTPNAGQAQVKIPDSVEIERCGKDSKQSQTDHKRKLSDKIARESISCVPNGNEEYVYKYSFRKVFLQSSCNVCKKELKQRVPCAYCSLVFYCSAKHKDEDWPAHQALCFAVSTIVHLKDQKHIYANAKNIVGHDYRLLRMHMIVSCEKVLKRKLVPWEQEALLYPRICADVRCREWRQSRLLDCTGCGQISYCVEHPDHLPVAHQRWCKSYSLYQKLVTYQQTVGRLELKLPTKVMAGLYQIPEKLNEVLATMYEEKIDMSDTQYAALTQLATAPLTTAYGHQLFLNRKSNAGAIADKKSDLTVHVVGAELQFEADALNKWEVFLLHLRPDLQHLQVVLISPDLNPSNLPLGLLGKIKLCQNCTEDNRRVTLSFQDKKTYHEYWSSIDFVTPDIVCAFNPSIQRSSTYNGKDHWPTTISIILKLKVPFLVTSYTIKELSKDLMRIKECGEFNVVSEPRYNTFASLRPDRNFITDDEMPLLFKNYCFMIVSGDV